MFVSGMKLAPGRALLVACLLQGCNATIASGAGFKFTVLAPDSTMGRCCPTAFFKRFMDILKTHEDFTDQPSLAQVVFIHLDTLRMCEWPALRMLPNGAVGCKDGGGDPQDPAVVGGEPENGADMSCGWCCPQGTDIWLKTVQDAIAALGTSHTYIFFKNAQDTRFVCREFDFAKLKTAELGVQVRFVGFQLQQSQMEGPVNEEDTIQYPLKGVSLLVPLTDEHQDMPESDDLRTECHERAWLAYFNGQRSTGIRDAVFDLADSHPKFAIRESVKFGAQDPMGYEETLRDSVFGFVPRGDEHYTFRLTEVMAAGAVPIVIDDDFYAPYATEDISDWAVVIPESEVSRSVEILTSLDNTTLCQMKKRGAEIWKYGRNVETLVAGMLVGIGKLLDESPQSNTLPSGVISRVENIEAPAPWPGSSSLLPIATVATASAVVLAIPRAFSQGRWAAESQDSDGAQPLASSGC